MSDTQAVIRTLGAAFLGLMVACGDDSETPAAADSTGTSGESTGPPPAGDPPPPRPETRHCRFDGWAPGLLPSVVFEPSASVDRSNVSALQLDDDGVHAWVGTEAGAVLRVEVESGSVTESVVSPSGASIVGLARAGEFLFVRLATAAPTPAVEVERYAVVGGQLDLTTRVRVFRLPHAEGRRAGAGLGFDLEGNLIVPVGDLAEGDSEGPARDRTERAGSVLRFDVSALALDYDYAIPSDNPWADEPSPANEAWAVGLRDPAGCAVDGATGDLWCADVGVSGSEGSVVAAAADLGWPAADGATCLLPSGDCSPLGLTGPRVSFDYGASGCGATAGAVVRSGEPLLDGAYLFGDRCSGELWGARLGAAGAADVTAIVARVEDPPVAFDTDNDGDVWMLSASGALGRVRAAELLGDFPERLSDSGCFEDLVTGQTAPDVVPYEINSALWSDGAVKRRAIVLPPGETIEVDSSGALTFPEGTALLKTFAVAFDDAEPDTTRPVETRVMLRRRFGWEFHSYQWNEEGDDAILLHDRSQVDLMVQREGQAEVLPYTYPSRNACTFCHGGGESQALGPRIDQLSRSTDYGSGPIDQIEALTSIGMFAGAVPAVPAMAAPLDEEQSLEDRSRAYLHSNCGHCHRPGGFTPPDLTMDLQWTTPLSETALCDDVQYGWPTFDADVRIVPGDPEASLVWLRLSHRGDGQMPPTGTFVVDPTADVIREWVQQLTGCG